MRKESTDKSKLISDKKLIDLKKNAIKRLSICRQTLLSRQPFIGTLAMSFNIKPVRDCRLDTAATDGKNIYFDIDFLSRLNDDDAVFIIAHEVWHNVMCHFLREESRDRDIFNIASDIEINEILINDGFISPKDAMRAKVFGFTPGLSAEDYYELLIKRNNKQSSNSNNGSSSSNGSSSNQPNSFDKHIYKDYRSELDPGCQNVDDRYGKVEYDSDYTPNIDNHAIENIREAAISAAQLIERQAGELPAHLKRLVNKMLKPEIPWQEILCQFVSKCYGIKANWSTPNRRFVHSKIYLPSKQDNCINVIVGLDTSASTDSHLPKFLGELNSLVKSFAGYNLNIIEADTEICKHEIYNDEHELDLENVKYTVNGGGGTELHSIFNYIDENNIDTDAIIIFTDGYNFTHFNEHECPSIPTLWMITPDGTDEYIHFGEIVKLH